MTIKPLDILHLLEDEDIEMMEYIDLNKLCIMITLDEQLNKEEISNNESFSNRGNLC